MSTIDNHNPYPPGLSTSHPAQTKQEAPTPFHHDNGLHPSFHWFTSLDNDSRLPINANIGVAQGKHMSLETRVSLILDHLNVS